MKTYERKEINPLAFFKDRSIPMVGSIHNRLLVVQVEKDLQAQGGRLEVYAEL